jgi:transcriptional regulator with XRE-family HTH domain
MSGIKPPELQRFYDSLAARGLSPEKLADIIQRSRPAVTRVLNGSRRRGPIWKKLLPYLSADEVALLDVAHCSPWNSKRVAKRPKWTISKAITFKAHNLRKEFHQWLATG